MNDIGLRVENIKEHVTIFDILNFYKIELTRGDGGTQQIRCPFHGHRGDKRPSARVYSSSLKFHCFYCGFTLDAIAFIQEYENINFLRALSFIEHHFNVPEIKFEDIENGLSETLDKNKSIYNDQSLLNLYEFCEDSIIKKKKRYKLKTYSKLFLFLESIVANLRDSKISSEEAFKQLTDLRVKIEV